MARLTAAQRAKMPKSDFANKAKAATAKGRKESDSFPMPDKKHARLAISGATRAYNAGNISKATENRVKAEARKKLGINKSRKG